MNSSPVEFNVFTVMLVPRKGELSWRESFFLIFCFISEANYGKTGVRNEQEILPEVSFFSQIGK